MHKRPSFITFEGIDGAGKSSHLQKLAALLEEHNPDVVITREPGGTALAEKLREMLLGQNMDVLTETLLVFAGRRDHLNNVIAPALQRGAVVVCDRFTDATFAYQCAAKRLPVPIFEHLESWVLESRQPDLTFWFDVAPSVAAARRTQTRAPDRFEREPTEFFDAVRQGYKARSIQYPDRFVRVDAEGDVEAVWKQIESVLQKTMGGDFKQQ